MPAAVVLRLEGPEPGDVEERTLRPGDLIGRAWSAAWFLDDARISEAHALLSLRGERFLLLALRGRLVVGGRPLERVELLPGAQVALTPDHQLTVLDVWHPDQVLAIEGPDLPATPLPGAAALDPAGYLTHPTDPRAIAWLWPGSGSAPAWRLRLPGGPPRAIGPNDSFEAGTHRFTLSLTPLRSTPATVDRSVAHHGLRLVVRYDTLHLFRAGDAPLVIDGLGARLVGELVAFGVPVPWRQLARELWRDTPGEVLLRKRLDGLLGRLRKVLREGGVRPDLVRTNGQGCLELLLDPEDQVEDQL